MNESVPCAYNDDAICKAESAYQGLKNVTTKGLSCINWQTSGTQYSSFGDNNHCRTTNGHGPWCYTGSGKWGYCFETCPNGTYRFPWITVLPPLYWDQHFHAGAGRVTEPCLPKHDCRRSHGQEGLGVTHN